MAGTGLLFLYVDTQTELLSNVIKIVIYCVSFQVFCKQYIGCWKVVAGNNITGSTSYMTFNFWLGIRSLKIESSRTMTSVFKCRKQYCSQYMAFVRD